MGTPFPDLGYLRGEVFSFFHFLFDLSNSYILHLSRGVMLKLILVLCLFGIAVLAKPSRLQAKTDVRQMDDGSCAEVRGTKKAGIEVHSQWKRGETQQFACEKGVGYYCERRTWIKDKKGYCQRTCRKDGTHFGFEWMQLVKDDGISPFECDTHLECVHPNAPTYRPSERHPPC